MFDEQTPAGPVQDIFNETEAMPRAVRPTLSGLPSRIPPEPGPAQPLTELPNDEAAPGKRRWMLVGGGAAVVLLVGVGIWAGYRWLDSTPTAQPGSAQPLVNTPSPIAAPEAAALRIETAPPAAESLPAPEAPLDTDRDGLIDSQERDLGTNPALADSDSDGLLDWEEVNVYHTNSNNPDSDGDSYQDGLEVKSGYNPAGPGKLLDLQRALQNVNR